MAAYKGYEPVIGVEVHCELKTASKVFCSCSAAYGNKPNTACCPVCMGLPGALPQLNGEAVRLTIQAGIALHCHIQQVAWFDRKNYFYPDLPKGYQITQNDTPFCTEGYVTIQTNHGEKKIQIRRIHLEEDAGKLLHREADTAIDFNRCGVGLIEIVTEPVLSDPLEVKAYLTELRRILLFAGVSDCRMNEGSMRCEVNVSVRPGGSKEKGVRCEVKNIGSIQFAAKAVEDEWHRQADLLASGGVVEQETRRFNETTGHTELMRKKEAAVDYRYFTEPNIPPVHLSDAYVDALRFQMPMLPADWIHVFETYGLTEEMCELVTQTPTAAAYCKALLEQTKHKKTAVHLLVGEVLPLAEKEGGFLITPSQLAQIADMVGAGEIGSTVSKKLIHMTAENGEEPRDITIRENLFTLRNEEALLPWVRRAIEEDPRSAADFWKGKLAAKKRLLGGVIRATDGRADPAITDALLEQVLSEMADQNV